MSVADVKKNTEQKMAKSIETLKANLAKVRTGRAHTGLRTRSWLNTMVRRPACRRSPT